MDNNSNVSSLDSKLNNLFSRTNSLPKGDGILQSVMQYHKEGLVVVPLKENMKIPVHAKWQELQYNEQELEKQFFNGHNVGIHTGSVSNYIIDLDFDAPEVRALAPIVFPKHNHPFFGRKSARNSHCFVKVQSDLAIINYDLTKAELEELAEDYPSRLLEIRGSNHQTMVPPSIHPEGEQLAWNNNPFIKDAIPSYELHELKRKCGLLCFLALCAKKYAPNDMRHDFCLALAGSLAYAGYEDSEIIAYVGAVCEVAGDPNYERRADSVKGAKSSQNKLNKEKEGKKIRVAGLPKLCKIAGFNKLKDKLHEWLYGEREEKQDFKRKPKEILELKGELVEAIDVIEKPIDWIWFGYLAQGTLNSIFGAPGDSKGFFMCLLVSHVTNGTAFPDDFNCEKGNVIILPGEDILASVLRPRLRGANANLNNVSFLPSQIKENGEPVTMHLKRHISFIEEKIIQKGNVKLLVVDPLESFLGGIDSNKSIEMRDALMPLSNMAERLNVAVLLIDHTRKSEEGGALERQIGSRAKTGIVRSIMCFIPDPDNKEIRYLCPVKQNNTAKMPGWKIRIDTTYLDNGICVAKANWIEKDEKINADHIFARIKEKRMPTKKNKMELAEEFLREFLKDGEKEASVIKDAALKKKGIGATTIDKAADNIGVEKTRRGQRQSYWSLIQIDY
jgi:putative DNA primase/helicase